MLLLVLVALWVLAALVVLALCRSAASGDTSAYDGAQRWRAAHTAHLPR